MSRWMPIKNDKLNPCLCGAKALLYSYYIKGVANHLNYIVSCPQCMEKTRNRRKVNDAIEEWNLMVKERVGEQE